MEEILHQFRLVFYSTITYDGFLYIPGGSPDFSSINSIAVLGLVSNDLWKNLPNSAQNDAFLPTWMSQEPFYQMVGTEVRFGIKG